jgi:hypothetical protein
MKLKMIDTLFHLVEKVWEGPFRQENKISDAQGTSTQSIG